MDLGLGEAAQAVKGIADPPMRQGLVGGTACRTPFGLAGLRGLLVFRERRLEVPLRVSKTRPKIEVDVDPLVLGDIGAESSGSSALVRSTATVPGASALGNRRRRGAGLACFSGGPAVTADPAARQDRENGHPAASGTATAAEIDPRHVDAHAEFRIDL